MQGITLGSVGRVARLVALVVAITAGSIISTLADAQVPQPLPQPTLNLLTNGSVYAITRLVDGSVVIGGHFISVNGVARSNIAKRRADGTLDPDWHPSIDGDVRSLATDSAGNVYAGGEFTTVSGLLRRNLVKIASNGDVVAGWDPSPDGVISAMALHAADELFVGGDFATIGGIARNKLAKLSQSSGTVDTPWNPDPSSTYSVVLALANSQDGKLIVGGSFSTIGGLARRNIAKISYTGSGTTDSTWDPAPNQGVNSIAVGGDGAVFITGSFTQFGDLGSNGVIRWGIAKLDGSGTGAIVTAWDPFHSEQFGWAHTVAVDDGGSVYIGGGLTYFVPSGEIRYGIVKASASGTGSIDISWNPAPKGDVYAIAVGSNSVYAGGSFDESGSASHLGFLAIDDNGALVGIFDVESPDGAVLAIARQADGGLIVGGRFVKANGQERRSLLRLNPDGSLDMAWNPSANGPVRAIVIGADGSVFVGGLFSEINGNPLVGVAKLSGIGSGAPNVTWNPGLNSSRVNALSIDANGFVYVAGQFATVSGNPTPRNLVRVASAGSGVIDGTWTPDPLGEVKGLSLDGGGSLFAYGNLFNVSGEVRRYIAKLLTTGPTVVDPNWNPNPSGQVISADADGLGSIFVSGSFSTISGQPRSRLAKLSTSGTGSVDPLWMAASQGDAELIKVAAPQGALFAVSSIYDPKTGISDYSLTKYSSTGTGAIDPSWHPTVNDLISTLVPDGNNLLVGGYFTQVSGQQRDGLAALPINVPDVIYASGFDSP